jgi:dipeptidyl aminopeptidase/acylaminoacyl peptidase
VGEAYERASNVVHAHRLEGELLLIVGELDDNVDPAATLAFARALEQAGKRFELEVIPGAGHGAAETEAGSRLRADFLVRHLRPDACAKAR